jgi:hypothetical protein
MARKTNIKIGDKYGKLTVKELLGNNGINARHYKFLCHCECGGTTIVQSNHLTKGSVKSCGCLVNAKQRKMSDATALYLIYKGMKKRCYNKNDTNYKFYGGKGIKLCDEWLDYKNFKEWAFNNGFKYDITKTREERLSIDRIDSSKNYSPSNCRWITLKENRLRRVYG